MKKLKSLLLAAILAAAGVGTSSAAPYYRLFQGFKLPSVSQADYQRQISGSFIPAFPAAFAGKGASAYLPALPPEDKPAAIPDEFALMAWDSEEAHDCARQTPEGRRQSDMHWTLFDATRSKGGAATELGVSLNPDQAYDVIGKPVDWQKGYSTFFIGSRKQDVGPEEFLKRMREHVSAIRDALTVQGLDGYVMIAGNDYEAAYLHWPDQASADAAFASESGRAAGATGTAILDPLMWVPAAIFNGKINTGQAVNVQFERPENAK